MDGGVTKPSYKFDPVEAWSTMFLNRSGKLMAWNWTFTRPSLWSLYREAMGSSHVAA
jgi:hypothetical protein